MREQIAVKNNLFFGFTYEMWKKAAKLDFFRVKEWTPVEVMLFLATSKQLKVVRSSLDRNKLADIDGETLLDLKADNLKELGVKALATIDNHHNFAWKEQLADGREVVVHRKGATPAHKGTWGIIPGSMTAPAYLVMGKGAEQSLNSASHGAGRAMSRQKARSQMTGSALKKMLSTAGVKLIGGSVEENPLAYKDIEQVIAAQGELIDIHGTFYPKIVRMYKD